MSNPSTDPASPSTDSSKSTAPSEKQASRPPVDMAYSLALGAAKGRSSVEQRSQRREFFKLFTNFSLISLLILFVCIVAFMAGGLSGGTRMTGISGIILISLIPAVITTLVFAVMGLRQSSKKPDKYPGAKVAAICTLVVGTGIGVGVIMVIGKKIRGPEQPAIPLMNTPQVMTFREQGFVFHMPRYPWVQAEPRMFGPATLVALRSEGPLFFSIAVLPLQREVTDNRAQFIEMVKNSGIRNEPSYKVRGEMETVRNGVQGLQLEVEVNIQGHNAFVLDWLVATNGFGYQLSTWGDISHKEKIIEESQKIIEGFEIRNPQ